MAKTVYVDCPFCEGLMEIDLSNGKVLEKWEKGEKPGSGEDKMASAIKSLEEKKKKRKDLFSQKKEELDGQRKKLASSFSEEVQKLKKKGSIDKPMSPFDLD